MGIGGDKGGMVGKGRGVQQSSESLQYLRPENISIANVSCPGMILEIRRKTFGRSISIAG